jgi:hypothetical protein
MYKKNKKNKKNIIIRFIKMIKKAQVGNEHSVPCSSYFNEKEYQLPDPNRSGASRFQMAQWLRDNEHKVPHSKDGKCRSMKRYGESVPQPVDYTLEDVTCGDRRDDALHNKSFEEIHAMAIDYNNRNPGDMIPYIGEKNKLELCHDLIEKGQNVFNEDASKAGSKSRRPKSRKACSARSMKWVPKTKKHIGFCRVKNNSPAKKSKSKSRKSRKSKSNKAKKSKSRKAQKAPQDKIYYW